MTNGGLLEILLYIDLFILGVVVTVTIQHWYRRVRSGGEQTDPRLSILTPADKKEILNDARRRLQNSLDTAADRLEHDLKATSERISIHLDELGNQTADAQSELYRQQLEKLFMVAENDVRSVRETTNDYINRLERALESLHEQAKTNVAQTENDVATYVDHHQDQMQLLLSQATKTIEDSNQNITEYKQSLKSHLDQLDAQAQSQISDVGQDIETYKQQLKTHLQQQTAAQQQQIAGLIDAKLTDAVLAFLNEAMQHEVDLGAQADYLISVLEENKATLIQEVTGDRADQTAN